MSNFIYQKPKDFKLIGLYDEKFNRIDFAMPIKIYEDEQYKNYKVPEMECFKKYDFMQIPLETLRIPEPDRRFLDKLKQNDVITFKATFVEKAVNVGFNVDPLALDFKFTKIWDLKKFNKPKAYEKLSNIGRKKIFQFHFKIRPNFI